MSFFRGLVAVLLSLGVFALSACAYDPSTHSTKGVVLVSGDDGVAKIPAGETLVLKKSMSCGKTACTYYWRLSSRGEGRLTVIDSQFPQDRVRDFVVTNQPAEIDTYWLSDPLIARLDTDGSIIIDWPTGFWSSWDYQSYDPPR